MANDDRMTDEEQPSKLFFEHQLVYLLGARNHTPSAITSSRMGFASVAISK